MRLAAVNGVFGFGDFEPNNWTRWSLIHDTANWH